MKENNVSMFGGCLPTLLPLPILFALYGVFRTITATPGADTSFLFIPDIFAISKRDWICFYNTSYISSIKYLYTIIIIK